MKKLVIPRSLNQIKELINYVDGFIIGLKDMSVNMPTYFTLEEIKEISELLKDKELFVSINKNMHNSDLDYLKEVLIEFENYNIKGIFYYDVALVNLKEELNLKTDLVFSQEHSVTNYETINYWYTKEAKYAYLSNEITLHEIKEISKKTKAKLMVLVFGYIPIFVSERKLIDNYLKYFNIKNDSKKHYIEKEDKKYRLIEDKNATQVYSNYILNAIDELQILKENNIDYAIFNSFDIDTDKFIYIIKNINTITEKEVNNILTNTDKGFLYKETIYKVKNYEK